MGIDGDEFGNFAVVHELVDQGQEGGGQMGRIRQGPKVRNFLGVSAPIGAKFGNRRLQKEFAARKKSL